MSQTLLTHMRQILDQKGLPKEVLVEAIEAALLQAAKRRYGSIQSVQVELDEETGEIHVTAPKRVVEIMKSYATEIPIEEARKIDPDAKIGDVIQVPVDTQEFGRIEAQLARQILVQKIKDAERQNIYNLYRDRVDTLVTGTVQRVDRRDVIVELENAEAILPYREQLPGERYRRGDRIRALIIEVADPSDRDPERRYKAPVVLSRAHPVLLVRLFEQEVPEIGEGLVQIEGVARDPGERSKIAVSSTEEGIDPVGCCVGVRGSRVQMVMQELNGERIDVIPWSPDLREFVADALSPAQVLEVSLVEDESGNTYAQVVVPDDQLSLAIGRRGQNARLASRLTGIDIDIVAESAARAEVRSQVAELFQESGKEEAESAPAEEQDVAQRSVHEIIGITPRIAAALETHGYATIGDVAQADPSELAEILNVGTKTTTNLVRAAQAMAQLGTGSEEPESQEG